MPTRLPMEPPPMHTYFVSFWWAVPGDDRHGYGNFTASVSGPVRAQEHLNQFSDLAHEHFKLPDDATVIILNLIRLDA